MAVLLTGGAGYIGSHICVELQTAGEKVIIFDNHSNSDSEVSSLIEKITGTTPVLIEGDITDAAQLKEVFRSFDIEAVVHLAGLKSIGESIEHPLDYYTTNITGTLNLISAMKNTGCKRLVFSSSATVYGTNNASPVTEDMPISAANPYGQTKVMLERILSDIAAADSGWGIVMLRYFNPVAAHASGLIGENPQGTPNNLVPYIGMVAAGILAKINVFGGDYDTPDGTGVRDYIHVVDLARGHTAALQYVRKSNGCEAVNLGAGRGYSVLEMISAYEKACGRVLPFELGPRRAGDIASCWADCKKAEQLLGWHAEKSLDEMCADAWRYVKNRYKTNQ